MSKRNVKPKHGPMLEKVIIYKSDDTGMWWAELQEPITGKWRHVGDLVLEALEAVRND